MRASVATVLVLLVVLLGSVTEVRAEEDLDDVLGGFDEPSTTAGDEDLDDILEGFGESDDDPTSAGPDASLDEDRFFDVTAAVSLGTSYNVIPHRSSFGPPPDPLAGTYYGNLQRMRMRGDMQIDFDLPLDWRGRFQGFLFYDFAYLMHGRDSYTQQVLDDYEFMSEVLDFWVSGTLWDRLDLKLGRQVVNWGRSDTLRVTDVLNALNNREPGLVDIEDLRLPATMAKADLYLGRFNVSALVIPEIRYDYNPPPGSDFFPQLDLRDLPPPGRGTLDGLLASLGTTNALDGSDLPDRRAAQWGSIPEYGGSITGIFSGWDVSFYAARIYQNRTTLTPAIANFGQSFFDDDRVTMVGGGGNYTIGSWLIKAEIAWFDELDFTFLKPVDAVIPYDVVEARKGRVDVMGGIEYYGFVDTTIAIEIVNRYIMDYDPLLQFLPNFVEENTVEYAARVSNDWMNARLHTTLLFFVLGSHAQGGATIRASADYDIADGIVATLGFLSFIPGDLPPINSWGDNDRIFAKIKYTF